MTETNDARRGRSLEAEPVIDLRSDPAPHEGDTLVRTRVEAPHAGPPNQTSPERRRSTLRPSLPGIIFLVLCVLAALALGGWQVFRRLDARNHVQFEGVVLAVDDIGLSVANGGQVIDVMVAEQDEVSAGDVLATVESEVDGRNGATSEVEIVAPEDGLVLHVFAEPGERVGINEPVVTIYDPSEMHFRVGATYGSLTQVKIGTEATLRFTDIDDIEATFTRVEAEDPRALPAEEPGAVMILEPKDEFADEVRSLIPGLVLSADLDTETAPEGAPTGLQSAGLG